MADLINFLLDRQAIESIEPQAGEELDPGFERLKGITEGTVFSASEPSTEAGSGTPQ
jgi:hypothetical protein